MKRVLVVVMAGVILASLSVIVLARKNTSSAVAAPKQTEQQRILPRNSECVLKVIQSNDKMIYCIPKAVECEDAKKECRTIHPHAKTMECLPGCK